MRKSWLPLLCALVLPGCRFPDVPRDVLLVSIDAVPPELVETNFDQLNTLRSLVEQGSYARVQVEGSTVTMPAHAIMLTGQTADRTGVWAPSPGNYGLIPEGMGIHEQLRAHFGRNIELSFIATKPFMVGSGSGELPFFRLGEVSDTHWNENVTAEWVTPHMLDAVSGLDSDRGFFGFFHYGDPDMAAHGYGGGSDRHLRALLRVDEHLGRVVAQLERMGRLENTTIYVTTDHGFPWGTYDHSDPETASEIFVISNELGVEELTLLRELPWHILEEMGLPYDQVDVPSDLDRTW